MKKLAVIMLALTLVGCASTPQPKPQAQHSYTKPAKIVQPKPVAQPAPEAKPPTFKQRWFDRFMKHKSK